jgi:sarcosine oxidase subunit alpha
MNTRLGPHRLAQGGLIDRTRCVPFQFNGRALFGCAGDTLASALLANGIRTVARSFKFHRPRGIYSCGAEEPNALVQLGTGAHTLPAVRATVTGLLPGLEARSVRGWPSVRLDLLRLLDFTAPLWAAGFYNKTFIWPTWHSYESLIRRMAGFGTAPRAADPDRYETRNLHCDVVVVGGGPAGLEAAIEAGRTGKRVVLVEQEAHWGGRSRWVEAADSALHRACEVLLEQIRTLPSIRLMPSTAATGVYDHNVVALLERVDPQHAASPRERFWTVRAGQLVLATGTIEQPLIFSNNDRPGIVLAGAAQHYLHRYGVAIGSRVLVATNNDSVYALASDLSAAGVTVVGVVDSRQEVAEALRETLRRLSIPHFTGSLPVNTRGMAQLRGVTVGRLNREATEVTSVQDMTCDALAVSGGFNPELALFAQAGGRLRYDEASGALIPMDRHPSIDIVSGGARPLPVGARVSPVGDAKRQWVDLLHDVTVADLQLALRENYTSVEHVKRYTTVGMAADQGKTSAPASLDVLSRLRAIPAADLGYTTLRPPVTPVTLGAIAGREIGPRFAPFRQLPLHAWHVAHGGVIQEIGQWQRPVAYLREGETREDAFRREAQAVRTGVGLFDGSSLGKIEIKGPDALAFLDRFYINDLTTLKPFRARYGFMLRETGVLFDDGTVVQLAPDHYLITTTSGNSGRVAEWLEEWHQCEWPALRVAILPVTEGWATLSLAGPESRRVLAKVASHIDLSGEAFPHLAVREATVKGIPARIYRVSFTGELTYEINVPTLQAGGVWEALLTAGAGEGIQPFGLDALMLLRLEKGFLHLGADTDGTSIPGDIGWGLVAASKNADFIGKRSLRLPEHVRPDRMQLVGLLREAGAPFVIGTHLRLGNSSHPTDGWITSAGVAVQTREPIALALLRAGRARIGDDVELFDLGTSAGRARVVSPPFYDPRGERMHG